MTEFRIFSYYEEFTVRKPIALSSMQYVTLVCLSNEVSRCLRRKTGEMITEVTALLRQDGCLPRRQTLEADFGHITECIVLD
jgi:hypothetical protein